MAGSLNCVTLIGNVGRDPEIRSTRDGREIANLSLATEESWKDADGERQSRTEWHRVSIFSEGLVKVVRNYVHKGSKLYVSGKLQTRKWTDNDGAERYSTEIVLQGFDAKLLLLDSKRDGGTGDDEAPPARRAAAPSQAPELDDEIPF